MTRVKIPLMFWISIVFLVVLGAVCHSAPLMVEKNLFDQDRKPMPLEAVNTTPQAKQPGLNPKAIQLDGVVIYGDTRKAVIRFKGQVPGVDSMKGQPPFISVREGEKVGDYQVVKIEPKSISLEKDGQTIPINLFAEGKVVPPAPPVPVAQTAPGQPPNQVGVGPDGGAPNPNIPQRPPQAAGNRVVNPGVPPDQGMIPQNPAGAQVMPGSEPAPDEEAAPDEGAPEEESGQ